MTSEKTNVAFQQLTTLKPCFVSPLRCQNTLYPNPVPPSSSGPKPCCDRNRLLIITCHIHVRIIFICPFLVFINFGTCNIPIMQWFGAKTKRLSRTDTSNYINPFCSPTSMLDLLVFRFVFLR